MSGIRVEIKVALITSGLGLLGVIITVIPKPSSIPVPGRPLEERFYDPMFGNQRLDWCNTFASTCGQPAARTFCQSKLFSDVKGFEKDLSPTITHVIGDRKVCKESKSQSCDGFEFIDCSGAKEKNDVIQITKAYYFYSSRWFAGNSKSYSSNKGICSFSHSRPKGRGAM